MSAIFYTVVIVAALAAVLLGGAYYLVVRLMETPEERLLREADKQVNDRERVKRPF